MRNRWMWWVTIAGLCWSIAPVAMAKSASQSAQVLIIIPERHPQAAPADDSRPVPARQNPVPSFRPPADTNVIMIRDNNRTAVRYTQIVD